MSFDINNFLNNVKKAAIEAVNATKPFAYLCGNIIDDDGLKIEIEQKFALGLASDQVILTSLVSGENALEEGDRVMILRADGGQKFIVLDKLGG